MMKKYNLIFFKIFYNLNISLQNNILFTLNFYQSLFAI